MKQFLNTTADRSLDCQTQKPCRFAKKVPGSRRLWYDRSKGETICAVGDCAAEVDVAANSSLDPDRAETTTKPRASTHDLGYCRVTVIF